MQALSFDGKSFEYFKIWIVNILLTIVTLGIYYPWAKVRTNRYFYANSKLDGRNFEYHATGKQLFFGYLIAMGLLIMYTVLSKVSPVLSGIMLLVFILALPWIIWRSMIFGMRMTSFSNVRFGFVGNLWPAYLNYLILPIGLYLLFGILAVAVILPMKFLMGPGGTPGAAAIFYGVVGTLALFAYTIWAFSLLKKKNTDYKLNGTRYGQGVFKTDIAVSPLLKYALLGLVFGIVGFVLYLIIAALIGGAFINLGSLVAMGGMVKDNPQMMKMMMPLLAPVIIAAYIGLILVFMLAASYVTTRQRSYIFDNTVLDEKITFSSTLKARSLAWVSLSNLLAIIAPLIIAGVLFAIVSASFGKGPVTIALGAVIGLAAVFVTGLVFCWAKVRMTRLMLNGTSVNTEVGFDEYVTEKQGQESSLGDQIGDAFNVDIGLGV